MRGPITRRLKTLVDRNELSTAHLRIIAAWHEVSVRTLRRWLAEALASGRTERKPREAFELTDDLLAQYALVGGNGSELHRELLKQHRAGGPEVPSLRTVYRAINTALTPGERAGIRKGELARRRFDVYLRRPTDPDVHHRNAVWEADHTQAPVWVDLDGQPIKPWITWFIDCATNGICGWAVTPGYPDRGSVLAALRASILRDEPYGPFGGIPTLVRFDQGKDFLCQTVGSVLARFAVVVGDLPGYCPYLKGTVEALNGASKKMFFPKLPHFVGKAKQLGGKPFDPDAPMLVFEDFVELLQNWIHEWNFDLPKKALSGRTPHQAWLQDAWPLDDIPAEDLRLWMLEDDGRERTITGGGVSWRSRMYVGECMTGEASVGRKVRLRYMPHHDHEIEVFDASTGKHLGRAFLSDQATPQEQAQVLAARRKASNKIKRAHQAAAKKSRVRFEAVTTAKKPRMLGAMTSQEAQAELEAAAYEERPFRARRDLIPLRPPAPGWVQPAPPPPSDRKRKDPS